MLSIYIAWPLAGVTWLVFLLFRRVCKSPWPPLVAAACFGLHALRSDPVLSMSALTSLCAITGERLPPDRDQWEDAIDNIANEER